MPEFYTDDNGNRVIIRHTGPAGRGIPAGGTTGQIFVKASNVDYHGAWANPPDGTGAAVGPDESVDGNFVLFDGATGKLLKDSGRGLAFYASLSLVNTKVDKVTGKGLSKNDFTDIDKAKLDALSEGGFRGVFPNVGTGESDIVGPNPGDYFVVEVLGGDFVPVFWDSTNEVWVPQTYEFSLTDEDIAALLFNGTVTYSNADCRIFTDGDYALLQTLSSTVTSLSGGSLTPARGHLHYLNLTGTAITILAASDGSTNMVKIDVPSTVAGTSAGFDNGGASNGRLRYTGSATKTFMVTATVSASGATGDTLVMGIAKNGTVESTARVLEAMKTSGTMSEFSISALISLAANDYVEAFIGNVTDTSSPTIHVLAISAVPA